jgi:DNA replication protein DnaC
MLLNTRREITEGCKDCSEDSLCQIHDPQFVWVHRMALANIPRRYWPLEIEDTLVEEQPALAFVRESIAKIDDVVKRGLGVSFFGNVGAGKTTLTTYILKAALRAGYPAYFMLMESLLSLIKDSFDADESKTRLQGVRGISILALDDLGREYIARPEWVIARLDELIRWRDSMGLATFFTSNLSGDEFKARYGDAIVSLLSNTNRPMAIKGEDRRRKLNEWSDVCQP